MNWPKESWVLLLQSVLVGKAQEIYGSLSVEQSSNYEHVKEAILKAYELVPEGQDFKKLKQMVLLEEFKDKVDLILDLTKMNKKWRSWKKQHYALTHKMSSKSGNPQQRRYHGSGNRENISRNVDDRKRQVKSTENVSWVSK